MSSSTAGLADLGLADVDFGPGPVTMLGLCQLDAVELIPAANAEAVGLWHELAAFCLALACDAAAATLTHDHGALLPGQAGLGAERRFPGYALRRRLDARDQGCRFPTCTRLAARCHA